MNLERREGGAVIIVAITPSGHLALIRDPTKPPPIMYKFPGGTVDHDEGPHNAARRELAEETGLMCQSLRYMGALDKGTHMVHLFVARATSNKVLARGGEGEIPSLHTLAELEELVNAGEFLRQHLLCLEVVRSFISTK